MRDTGLSELRVRVQALADREHGGGVPTGNRAVLGDAVATERPAATAGTERYRGAAGEGQSGQAAARCWLGGSPGNRGLEVKYAGDKSGDGQWLPHFQRLPLFCVTALMDLQRSMTTFQNPNSQTKFAPRMSDFDSSNARVKASEESKSSRNLYETCRT
jgi:hypothetical protein